MRRLLGLVPVIAFLVLFWFLVRGPSGASSYSYDTGSLPVAAGGHVTIEISDPTTEKQTVKVLAADQTGRLAVETSGPYGGLVYVGPNGHASIGFRCPLPGSCRLSTRLTAASRSLRMTAAWRSPDGMRSLGPADFKIIEH